jgi:hypothetical protein
MTDNDGAVWRDEDRLPLQDLDRAVARSAGDGQGDDVTGNDAGSEAEFGHGPEAAEARTASGSHEPTDSQRAHRPSTTGRTGPDV